MLDNPSLAAFSQTPTDEAPSDITNGGATCTQTDPFDLDASESASSQATLPAPAPSAQSPIQYLGHYEILREIGSGGMGRVLLARDTKLGRLVAIKLLLQNEAAASRILAEARATALARHENIVVIYEVGTFQGQPFLVLEYVEGRTLRQILSARQQSTGRTLPRSLALEIVASVLRALSAAHKNGIVHRDLKPENIMLLDSGQVKVLDFGIARFVDSDAPRTREGTLPYMSPEQWRGDELDERSDLWAVGILLYELLAGMHPLAPPSPPTLARLSSVPDPDSPMPTLHQGSSDLPGLSALVARCLCKQREERFASADEVLTALEPFLVRSRFADAVQTDHPFAGLAAFQESDGDRFFGRERDVIALLSLLERQPLVVIAGASGAGKSSFVRAGLIPSLRQSGEDWAVHITRPGRTPLPALQKILEPTENATDLLESPAHLGITLRARCRQQGHAKRALIFVDQLEELYTLSTNEDERAAFLACLIGAADDASSPVRVVLCMRADFLDRLVENRSFFAHSASGLFFLPPMAAKAQRDALTRPVEAASYRFESEALVRSMLEELGRTKSPLPLLQFAATKLWEARDTERRLLTLAAYNQMGGVAGALAMHADSVVSGLSEEDQRLCRALFLRLVTKERTRAVVSRADLLTLGEQTEAAWAVVQTLASARLLLVDTDVEHGSARVEIIHESLLDRWPTLARWLDENAEQGRFLAHLRAAAKQWEASGETTGMLWRDRAADEARTFYEHHLHERKEARAALLGAVEERYLKAVLALAERERRTRNRILMGAFGGISVIASVMLYLGLAARREAQRADAEAAHVRNQNVELAAQALRGRNATRILAARKKEDDPTTVLSLLREVEPPEIPRDWPELVSTALSSGVAHDVWRTSPDRCAYSAVMSPDGHRIAVAMDDSTARILDDRLVERLVLKGHEKLVWTVHFSPDGKRVVTSSNDKTARIWDVETGRELLVLRGHKDALNAAMMSPDGSRIATASDDRTVRIWNAETGRELLVLSHDTEVNGLDWSPNSERIVTASSDGIGRIFSANGKGEPLLLRGHSDMLVAASFSPKGDRVATGGRDRSVRVWDAEGGAERVVLEGHEEKVLSVAFSPDGERLSSTSKDKTARIWRADGNGAPLVLRGHEHWVYTAMWSPRGDEVLTTSLDGTQRRFRLPDIITPTLLRGHEDTVRALVFTPDGERVVTASSDGAARIFRADGTEKPVVLQGHRAAVHSLRLSPDGSRLVTLSDDNTARIWAIHGAHEPITLRSPNHAFKSIDWRFDSDAFVTGTLDGTIQLWSKGGEELARTEKKTTDAFKWIRVRFDSAGKRVLVVDTSDPTIFLWNVEERGGLVPLGNLGDPVRIAIWSPDGSAVLGISAMGRVMLWKTQGAAGPMELHTPVAARNGIFSPDGHRLVLMLSDGTLLPFRDGEPEAPIRTGIPEEGAVSASFHPDGLRLLTCAPYGKVRVRNADGSGAPYVLSGSTLALSNGSFSPSGDRIGMHYEDKFVWVWPDVRPFSGTDDARLWRATTLCLTPEKRVELLGTSDDEARKGEQACKARVAEASRSAR